MTQETLSALLDGECNESDLEQALTEFDRTPGLKVEFSRMWMAREARRVRIRRADHRFADRVLAALDRPEPSGQNVVSLGGRLSALWRPAAGLALAAGMGAFAVLVLRPAGSDPAGQSPRVIATTAAPAQVREVADRRWNQLDPADAERLNAYLIAYSQSRAQHGMGSTLGYARYAAYTDEQRPQRIRGPRAITAEARQTAR